MKGFRQALRERLWAVPPARGAENAREAGRFGLTFGEHSRDGCSVSGGAWITPDIFMKERTRTAIGEEGPHCVKTNPALPGQTP